MHTSGQYVKWLFKKYFSDDIRSVCKVDPFINTADDDASEVEIILAL